MITKVGTNFFKGVPYDIYMLSGRAGSDAEDKPIGGKEHSAVSVAVAEQQDGTTVWVKVNGWRDLYRPVLQAVKGSAVFAVGQLKSREYNGRTYHDLDAEFVCVSGSAAAGTQTQRRDDLMGRMASAGFTTGAPAFAEIGQEDGELPF